eukprot:SAG11_NODE_7350_length_1157_cov_1.524575_2_plen_81_part_00
MKGSSPTVLLEDSVAHHRGQWHAQLTDRWVGVNKCNDMRRTRRNISSVPVIAAVVFANMDSGVAVVTDTKKQHFPAGNII